jgi:NAD(P)H-dependent flavin oxidoreductase YrpB (nitropropane dioxygenase family)
MMKNFELPGLKIGKFFAPKCIVQGGMSVGISMSGLASAVANEGGIGIIGAAAIGMLEKDYGTNYKEANQRALRREIRKAREKTKGLIGVNIMVALTDYDELWQVAIEEEVDFVFAGAGLPIHDPKTISYRELNHLHTRFVPIVSSARATRLIFAQWEKRFGLVPDAVVVEGPLAGGHLGFKRNQIDDPSFQLENIVPEVIQTVAEYEQKFSKEIPVIAAGGIYSGEDIYRFLQLGAKGVQMATRFVATYECDASPLFKEAYLRCKKEDIAIIQSPVGLPGRAIRNSFLKEVAAGMRKPYKCPWHCLKTCDYQKSPYCISLALTMAQKGKMHGGFAFCGANAYKVDKLMSVHELITELETQYKKMAQMDHRVLTG